MASTLLPVATIGTILNLTPTRVQQLAKDGVIPKSSHGQYELLATVQSYIRYLQERVHGGGGSKTSADISNERARLLKGQADIPAVFPSSTSVVDEIEECKLSPKVERWLEQDLIRNNQSHAVSLVGEE